MDGELTTAGRCRVRLLLTEEEASRLAEAVQVSGAPSRSLLILESLQAGLHAQNLTGLQHRRNHHITFWLPKEVMNEVRLIAGQLGVSQQSLMRHNLATYLAQPPWKANASNTHRRPTIVKEAGAT